jgi:class 3 adenylate cyclase
MKNLIPYFVHERFKARQTHGRFQAVTLFVDISGFTPLTERLMQHEKDGAEVLTDVLNHIFSPLVAEVYTQGGFVTTFAGDAFTAVFPLREAATPQHALAAATFIQDFFARQGRLATRYGQFEMGVKVGLSLGSVHWGILGAHDRYTYFFRGTAVDACARAESWPMDRSGLTSSRGPGRKRWTTRIESGMRHCRHCRSMSTHPSCHAAR